MLSHSLIIYVLIVAIQSFTSFGRSLRVKGFSLLRPQILQMVSQSFPRTPVSSSTTTTTTSNSSNKTNSYKMAITNSPVVLGIAGGSASGKTTLAKMIIDIVGKEHISFIGHDSYYRDLRHLSLEERSNINFDHPNSLDTDLLIEHIKQLKMGKQVNIPCYDFTTHSRTPETSVIMPRKIIIVDGILIFSEPKLLDLMDMKIFVDTEDDMRLIRRINRDTNERGRNVQSVIDQYIKTVRPMHQLYVEPSKRNADIIVPAGQGIQAVALDMCVSRLREIINFYQ